MILWYFTSWGSRIIKTANNTWNNSITILFISFNSQWPYPSWSTWNSCYGILHLASISNSYALDHYCWYLDFYLVFQNSINILATLVRICRLLLICQVVMRIHVKEVVQDGKGLLTRWRLRELIFPVISTAECTEAAPNMEERCVHVRLCRAAYSSIWSFWWGQ